MNPSTAQARVLVDELVRGGVRRAVIAPGSRSAPLALALERHAGMAVHTEIDERSAGFLALGIAKAVQRPVAVVCTSGTAVANLHPAVIEAHHSRTPLLLVTADRPGELRDTGANQTIDQVGLFGSAVRWAADMDVATERRGVVSYWRSMAARAVAEATGRPAGPVQLNVPLRDPLAPTDDESWIESLEGRQDGQPWTSRTADHAVADPSTVQALAGQVARTSRGALVLGDVAVDSAAAVAFASAAGWPVLADPHSNARTSDSVVSVADLLLADGGFSRSSTPHMAVVVGRPVLARSVRRWLDEVDQVVLIDADGWWLDPARRSTQIVRADPSAVLDDVAAALGPPPSSDWLSRWQQAERAARAAIDKVLDAQTLPTEPRVARDLAECLPDGTLLAVASSMPIRDLASVMRPRAGLRVLGNRGASGIDGFVSTVLGAAIAHDGPVVALTGDLSLLHDQNGFLLGREDRPDAVFVVLNNDGGGIFSLLEYRGDPGFERLFGTPHGLRLATLAELYGLAYHPLVRATDLGELVGTAVSRGGISLIEVRTSRGDNAKLHQELQRAAAGALR